MAQPINEGDVLEVVAEGTNEGTPWAIVRHYLVSAVADAAALLDAVRAQWEETIFVDVQEHLTDKWQAECLSISRVAPQPMNVFFVNFAAPIVGDVTTDGLPNQTAALCRLATDEVGARNRGRLYLCGIPEASSNGGLLTAAALAALDTDFFQRVIDTISSAGNTAVPCIFSRTTYTANPAAPVANYTSAITGGGFVGNLAVQRRRRYRRNATG